MRNWLVGAGRDTQDSAGSRAEELSSFVVLTKGSGPYRRRPRTRSVELGDRYSLSGYRGRAKQGPNRSIS